MINMQPHFVSTEDFYNYWGINLDEQFSRNNSPSNFGNMLLRRVEDRLMNWIDANTFRLMPWEYYEDNYNCGNEMKQKYVDIQKDYWRKAILEQAMYVFKNSDIAQDSGYDPERGIVASGNELESIEVCRPCINYLKNAGLLNHVMKNRNRYTTLD